MYFKMKMFKNIEIVRNESNYAIKSNKEMCNSKKKKGGGTLHLSVSAEVHCIVSLPRATSGRTNNVLITLAVATVLLSSGGKASKFSVFHHRGDDPVNTWVTTDCLVLRVDKNNLKVLVAGVLANPVRIEHTKGATLSSSTLFSLGSK